MATLEQLLKIVREQIGIKESPPNSNNVKYNTWYYGKEVQDTKYAKYPWCAVFVQWCFNQVGMKLPIMTASCTSLMNACKKIDKFVTSNYQPGDVVFYDLDGKKSNSEHCGIIEEVGKGSITAIEGNTSVSGSQSNGGEVCRKTRSLSIVLGAYRPTFEEEKMDINTLSKMTDEEIAFLASRIQEVLSRTSVSKGLKDEFNEAIKLGITDGNNPNAFCTRAQAAVMNLRTSKLKK